MEKDVEPSLPSTEEEQIVIIAPPGQSLEDWLNSLAPGGRFEISLPGEE